jgi:hypothetical protein
MAKKKARNVTLSISSHAIDDVMAEIGCRVGSVGGGTVEYETSTFLSDELLVRTIAQRIAERIEIIQGG